MKILVANNHLARTGGTESYTYTLAIALQEMGHEVEYFTFHRGDISERMESRGISWMSHRHYDLILANHLPVVDQLYPYGFIIQTCHGVFPDLEQPSPHADRYVSISEEVQNHLMALGIQSEVILNGIDCNRFKVVQPLSSQLRSVLSMCLSDELNSFIKECCDELGVRFLTCNKIVDNDWNVEQHINEADLVVGIGRSLYDSMACGRCVISYDSRGYVNQTLGDGYLTKENIWESLRHNCSGRSLKRTFSKEEFIAELRRYNPSDGHWAREFVLNNLNIRRQAQKYIKIYEDWKAHVSDDFFFCKLQHLKDELNGAQKQENQLRKDYIEQQSVINAMQHEINNAFLALHQQDVRFYTKYRKYLRTIRLIVASLAVALLMCGVNIVLSM